MAIALRDRVGTHESVITLGHEQVLNVIASGSSQALLVHVIASLKNAERFYLAIASFPVVENAVLQRKIKGLVLNTEDMGVIYLDCLSVNRNQQNTKTHRGSVVNMWELVIRSCRQTTKNASVSFQGPQYGSSRQSAS
jgi:hypothetical protein